MENEDALIQWLMTNAPWVLEKSGKLLDQLRGIQNWWKETPVHVDFGKALIVGAGGVGKSTLGKVLTGEALTQEQWEYLESLDIEHLRSGRSNVPHLTVLPGQEHRRRTMWELPLRSIENDGCKGLILVTCNGHNSLGEINVESHKLWKGNLKLFREEFIEANVQNDLEVVDQIVPFLQRRRSKFWVLHVINKADLWWKDVDRVRRDASSSEIHRRITAALRPDDRHETRLVSLSIKNVITADGRNLFMHHNSFDQREQVSTQQELFNMIEALQAWSDTDA